MGDCFARPRTTWRKTIAAPSEAEVQTQIGLVIQFLDEADEFARVNAWNVSAKYDALIANPLEGDWSADVLAAVDDWRGQVSGLMDDAAGRAMIDPLLLTYAKVLSFPDTDPDAILRRLYQSFVDNSLSVETRVFSFGSPSADGGNAGDGTLNRLTKDRDNQDIENQTPDAKVVTCVADEHSGAQEHRENFEIRGAEPPRDFVAGVAGGQRRGNLRAISSDDSEAFLSNPSFGQLDGTLASPTTIPGWTPNTIGNFELVEGVANVYRGSTSEGEDPRALKITTSDKVVQNFNVNGAQFNPGVPYYCQVAVNKDDGAGAGGNIVLRLGSSSTTLALASFAAGWNIVRIAVGSTNWFENWNQENPTLEIEWTSASAGYLVVDDVVLAPYQFFDGGWYAPVGGAAPWLSLDGFSFSDSETGAIIQEWLWRLYGAYLPHSATPTWADPT